jgi:hypothetical protein
MKKKNILFPGLLCFPAFLSAQHSLQSGLNMYRAEDIIIKQQIEYKDPGRTGANVLWDFSRQNIVNDEYELFYSEANDTMIIGTEHETHYRYALSNDSLLLWGFDNPTTKLYNVQPELLLKFPVNYGDTVKDYYYAHGKYGNRLEMDVMGTLETGADSYGMMILPNKDTLRHVLRTHSIKYIVEDTRPISNSYYAKLESPLHISPDSIDRRIAGDSVLFVVETFRWYEKGYRYPIFETVRSWEQHSGAGDYEFLATAFFYPPQDHYYLEDDADNLALSDKTEEDTTAVDPWEGLSYNIFPNPVKTTPLLVEIYLSRPANIRVEIRNQSGLLVLNENKGYHPAGICNLQLTLYSLPVGNYILDIGLDEKLISGIIMKR